MAIRYELNFLLHLKESPLCVKPSNLPPREEWMGPPPEAVRPPAKTNTDRTKPEGSLLEQGSRRPGVDRFGSRNGGSDGIVLGPPRITFSSSTLRNSTGDADRGEKTPRDPEARDRFLRGRIGGGGGEGDDRFRGGRNNNFRGRGDDRDTEGWSTVKPRKSFGQEGAERFTGRMGGEHRHRDDRGKERDDHDSTRDRPRRHVDTDGEDGDVPRRNGLNRGRSEPWFKDTAKPTDVTERGPSNRERIEKAKSWRVHDHDEKVGASRHERGNDRGNDRRWDRDREQRASEREPEWLDEPVEDKSAGHTEADLKKFMESMKANRGGPKASEKPADTPDGPPGLPTLFNTHAPAVKSAPAVEKGPDKFFAAFGETQLSTASPLGGERSEASKISAGKSSRFANLFSSQTVESRGPTEPPTPAAAVPPPSTGGSAGGHQSDAEKEAFQALLSKLRVPRPDGEQATPTPPNAGPYPQPPPPPVQPQHVPQDPIQNLEQGLAHKINIASPELMGPYGIDRREEPRLRSVPPAGLEILAPRPVPPPNPPSARPEQMLQELVTQRHNAQSQGSGRIEQDTAANSLFLMQLMQSGRQMHEQPPMERLLRMQQPQQRQASMPSHFQEREPDFSRERGPAQRQMRPQPPAGFIEEQFRRSEGDGRPIPTQILQRPPMAPPGLDQGIPQQQQQQPWMQPGQQVPPGQRPMIPPPGLVGNPNRNVPIPGMFNPNMPLGAFPPENMSGPRMQPPPGFFGGGPPPGPGFMPGPPAMGGGFPGPEGMLFPGGPFDGRGGMPPPGAAPFRR